MSTAVAALLVIASAASFVWYFSLIYGDELPEGRRLRGVSLTAARFMCVRDVITTIHVRVPSGWNFKAERMAYGVMWLPRYFPRPTGYVLFVPLWIPLLVAAIPASILWRSELRRRQRDRANRCRCGYDRRGLAADAKCPECGTVPAPASK